jgi:ADP-heptose:LPS heptosyltransferase
MADLTRQDVNQMIDAAKNNILQRLPDRNDLSVATNTVRERLLAQIIESSHQQQAMINRSNAQRTQLVQRAIALEQKMISLERNIQNLTQLLQRLTAQQEQFSDQLRTRPSTVAPAPPPENTAYEQTQPSYSYNLP